MVERADKFKGLHRGGRVVIKHLIKHNRWYIHSRYESRLMQTHAQATSCWMLSQDQVDRSLRYQTCTVSRQQ